jgi:hypothetical protein
VSSYFNNLFFAQWKEKGQEEFIIIHEEDDPDFDIDSFQLMIYAALSLGWMVPELLELFKGDFFEKFNENEDNILHYPQDEEF